MTDAWPTELRVSKDRKSLAVAFDNGESYDLTAELLRVASPSAEVQGHSPEQRVTVPGKADVEIVKMEPIGNYAVRITFDDMHDTGLFSWDYLLDLGRNRDTRWQAYLDELAEKGLGREPAVRRRP
ncbi:MAG: gamma-butyrobetaine hydroxylase-like domain-containing protein [Phyllobacterium sp.]